MLPAGCARAVSMPGTSSPQKVQRLYFANFRIQIRDLPSIPDYRFSHATGFSPVRMPDKTVIKTIFGLSTMFT